MISWKDAHHYLMRLAADEVNRARDCLAEELDPATAYYEALGLHERVRLHMDRAADLYSAVMVVATVNGQDFGDEWGAALDAWMWVQGARGFSTATASSSSVGVEAAWSLPLKERP